MDKPHDIPEQVWDEAGRRARGYVKDGQNSQEHFARTILAERLRCDAIVREEWHEFARNRIGRSTEKTIARILNRIRGVE